MASIRATFRRLRCVLGLTILLGAASLFWGFRPPAPNTAPAAAPLTARDTPSTAARALFGQHAGERNDKGNQHRVDLNRIAAEVERLRGLRFLRRVPSYTRSAEQVRAYVQRELDRESHWKQEEAFLQQFGFIPPKFDLRSFMLDLYTEQIAGYYDYRTAAFYMAPQATQNATAGDPSMVLLRALGMGSTIEDSLIVHEMDHAMQDQHFGIARLERLMKGHGKEDRSLAITALIEGDATIVMLESILHGLGLSTDVPLSTLMGGDDYGAMSGGGPVFSRAPPYIQKILLFPYVQGALFVDFYRSHGGWNAVNRIYANPPRSTEQVIHPEKYVIAPDEPRILDLPPELNTSVLAENTVGEERMRILWDQWVPKDPGRNTWSEGWGGDTFRVYARSGATYMLWATVWDNTAAARRFLSGIRRVLEAKNRIHLSRNPPEKAVSHSIQHEMWTAAKDGRSTCVERRGKAVVIIDDASTSRLGPLRALAWRTKALTAPVLGGKIWPDRFSTDERPLRRTVNK